MSIKNAKVLLENLITTGRSDDAATIRSLVDQVQKLSGHLMHKSHASDCPIGPRDPDAVCTCGVYFARDVYAEVTSELEPEPIDEAISLVFGDGDAGAEPGRRLTAEEAMARMKERCVALKESAAPDTSVQIDRDFSTVTRVEVIDETGRAYTRHSVKAEISIQDNNRTLKVFVSKG